MKKTPRGKAPAQPHDGLAKWTFSQLPHAAGLLKAALPAEMVAAVDWSTLRVEKGSFVDRALRGRHSDIVLSAKLDHTMCCSTRSSSISAKSTRS